METWGYRKTDYDKGVTQWFPKVAEMGIRDG